MRSPPACPRAPVALREEAKQQLRGAVAASQQERCVREKSTGIPLWRANGKEKQEGERQ